MYKDDLAFGSNSLSFLRCKHTKPSEEPEDGGYVVLGVQRWSCFYETVWTFNGVNIPSLARNLKMAAILSWVYKDDLAFISNSMPFLGTWKWWLCCPGCTKTILLFISNSLPFLRCKHTETSEEPEDDDYVVLVVQRRSCFSFLTVCPFSGVNIPRLARNLKMTTMLSWLYKDDLAFHF